MNITAPSTWRDTLLQRPILLSVAMFFVALLPRLVAIERYITPDELIWVYRSVNFREAIRAGMWADTLQAGHPGVTTMWLGSLGASIQLLFRPADQEIYQWITQLAWLTPDNMAAFQQLSAFLTSGRLAAAVVNSLGIVIIFWLARRLLGDLFALLVTAFLLLDPFMAGLSAILHVDGLATTFATISLLSLTLSLENSSKEWGPSSLLPFAALSGSAAALAVLAKSPALLLVPFAAMLYFFSLWRNRQKPFVNRLLDIFLLGMAWAGSFVLILFLLFPALWTSPLEVLQITSSNANRHVEEALRPTYFMGNVAFDHGLLFYPIALVWRMGPVVMIGLIILLGQLLKPKWRDLLPKLLIVVLVLWAAFFLIGISLAAKKFDRYILPIVPALALLAGVSWSTWLRPGERTKRFFLVTLLIIQLIYMVFVLPYPLAAYNLLLGGPFSAKYVMPIGWGESISRAGSWLSENRDVESKSAISGIAPSLAPFYAGETLLTGEVSYEAADYLIVTASSRQVNPDGVAVTTEGLDLLRVIRYGGLEQSWIYSNPVPQREDVALMDLPHPVTFGSQIKLLSQETKPEDDRIRFTARWDRQQSDDRFLVTLRLLDTNGHEWDSLETALLNEIYFFPEQWQPDEAPVVTYDLDLPPAIPPGEYQIELSLLDAESGSQLPVFGDDGIFHGVAYDAGSLVLEPSNSAIRLKDLNMIPVNDNAWEENSLRLMGYAELPDRVVTGGELNLDLFWQSTDILPEGLQVALKIEDEEPAVLPLSRFDSGLWKPGTVIQEKYRLHIPASLEDGDVSLVIQPLYKDGSRMSGLDYTLGEVEIQATDRLFALPEGIAVPLYAAFEPGILLRGAEPAEVAVTPGDVFDLTLFWQMESATDSPVTAFVHLVDDQGKIQVQTDRWPGGLPSNIWVPDQVVIDEYALELPSNIEPGNYQIVVGLYTAENGQRLNVTDATGQPYAHEAVVLPVTVTVQP